MLDKIARCNKTNEKLLTEILKVETVISLIIKNNASA
jgi:hypothetical protein